MKIFTNILFSALVVLAADPNQPSSSLTGGFQVKNTCQDVADKVQVFAGSRGPINLSEKNGKEVTKTFNQTFVVKQVQRETVLDFGFELSSEDKSSKVKFVSTLFCNGQKDTPEQQVYEIDFKTRQLFRRDSAAKCVRSPKITVAVDYKPCVKAPKITVAVDYKAADENSGNSSNHDTKDTPSSEKSTLIIIIIVSSVVGVLILGGGILYYFKSRPTENAA